MFLIGNPFGTPAPESPPAIEAGAPVVADNEGPLPGERVLQEVDAPGPRHVLASDGTVIRIDEETWQRMNGRDRVVRPVDYETK